MHFLLFTAFLLVSLQTTPTSWQLRSGWGHPAISSTLTPVSRVYFRTICVFIYKRSWPEHAPACRFQRPPITPPYWAHPVYCISKPILFFPSSCIVPARLSLVLPVWSYKPPLRIHILIVKEVQTASVCSKSHFYCNTKAHWVSLHVPSNNRAEQELESMNTPHK